MNYSKITGYINFVMLSVLVISGLINSLFKILL